VTVWRRLREAILSPAGRLSFRVGALLGLTALSQGCGFGILLLCGNVLGPDGLGLFLFALGVQGFLVLFASGGLGTVAVREVGRRLAEADPAGADAATTAYLLLVCASSALAHGVVAVAVALTPCSAEERAVLFWMLAGNVVGAVSLLPLFDARHRQLRPAFVTVLVDVATLAAFAAVAVAGGLTPPVAMALLAAKWVAIAVGHLALLAALAPLRWDYRPAVVRAFLRPGPRLLLAGFLVLVPLSGGVVVTRLLRTPADAAVIGLATQIALVHTTAWWQVSRILQPHILGPHGEEAWFVRRLAAGVAAALAGLTVALAGAAAVVFLWLLPPEYRDALLPTGLLLVAATEWGVAAVVWAYLVRRHREGAIMAGYLAGAVVYVPAAMAGTVALGPVGAAAASALAAAATLAVLVGFLRRPIPA